MKFNMTVDHEPKSGVARTVKAIADAYAELVETLGGIPDTSLKIKVVTPGEGQWEVQGKLTSTLGDGGTLVVINKPV